MHLSVVRRGRPATGVLRLASGARSLAFAALALTSSAVAATDLSLGSAVTVPGGTASIGLELAPGGSASHLQVDVLYDSSILTPGTPTLGPGAPDHVLDWAIIEPGTLRLVVYSLSCTPLGLGAANAAPAVDAMEEPGVGGPGQIATLPFTASPAAPPGLYDLVLSAPVLAGADGETVDPTSLLDGTIEIRLGPPAPEIPTITPLGGAVLALVLLGLALFILRRQRSRHGAALAIALALLGLAATRTLAAIAPAEVVDVILGRSPPSPSFDCNADSFIDVRDIACLLEPGCTAPTATATPTATRTSTPTPTATPTPSATPTGTPPVADNQAPVLTPPGNQ